VLLGTLYTTAALAKNLNQTTAPLKIAVIDTGINLTKFTGKVCKESKSFVEESWDYSLDLHGTSVAGLLSQQFSDSDNHCILVLRVFDDAGGSEAKSYLAAMEYALIAGAKFINMSYEGGYSSGSERKTIARLLAAGIKLFAAAGNSGRNLNSNCNAFPACYTGVTGVVATTLFGEVLRFSNYHDKFLRVRGDTMCYNKICMHGTSQATAIATGIAAKEFLRKQGWK